MAFRDRSGFVFDSSEKIAADIPAMDAYDRARQGIEIMTKVGVSGQLAEDAVTMLLAAKTIAEGLLAVADAVYIQKGLSRAKEDK